MSNREAISAAVEQMCKALGQNCIVLMGKESTFCMGGTIPVSPSDAGVLVGTAEKSAADYAETVRRCVFEKHGEAGVAAFDLSRSVNASLAEVTSRNVLTLNGKDEVEKWFKLEDE